MTSERDRALHLLTSLYGAAAGATMARLETLLEHHRHHLHPLPSRPPWDHKDVFLICYPDQVRAARTAPLQTLVSFSRAHLPGLFGGLHLLPFFPSSSDDGFAVTDFRRVDPALGTWEDVADLGHEFRLMVDLVLNHASAQGEWFAAFRRGEPPYAGFFRTPEPEGGWTQVVRPRTAPLFTSFETAAGPQVVWTTFGPDQVDLDYRQPQVLLEMIDVMLGTIGRGAEVMRLDAVAYVGKRSGTTCLHLPETHAIVQLLRLAVRRTAPWVRLITETNVPHQDGLSYLGDGDEADMIYAFALPPLVIYALTSGDAQPLADWVDSLAALPAETTLVNFVASHDGIGLNAAAGLLTDDQVAGLIHRARLAGSISYRSNRSRGDQPYELNVNLLDLLAGVAPDAPLPEDSIPRFLCAHAILLSLAGVPAVYFHSQVGSRGDVAGVRRTGRLRSINREKLDHLRLEQELSDPTSQRRRVFDSMAALLRVRRATPAFDPWAPQRLIGELPTSVFGIERTSRDGRQRVVCLHEVAGTATQVVAGHGSGRDLLSREPIPLDHVRLRPYQARWIEVVP